MSGYPHGSTAVFESAEGGLGLDGPTDSQVLIQVRMSVATMPGSVL
jgi:hypothetical protein